MLLGELAASLAAASFNRITIDGDTSTNDSFVARRHRQGGDARRSFDPTIRACGRLHDALELVAVQLAQAIVRDGEGATKFITIVVDGGRDDGECDRVARAIADSPLVKTAFFASDPNLGRIVCAIGNAAIEDLDPGCVSFWLDDVLVVADGGRAATLSRGRRQASDGTGRDRRSRRTRARRRDGDRVDLRSVARLRHDQRRLPELATA